MHRINVAGLVALAGLGFSDVQAGVELRDLSGGTVTLLEPDVLGPGKYRATVTSGTDVSFTLRFDAGDVVEEIVIVPLNQSGAKASVAVDGIPSFIPPAFYGLQQVKRVVRGFGAGEVWITKVQANLIGDVERDLDIGGNPNPDYGKTSGLIRANRIGNVIAHWSVLADIEATGTALSNPGGITINLVDAELNAQWGPQFALDGAILGDIRSNGGRIGTIRAASFISAVNNEASSNTQIIDTNGGDIGLIEAGSLGEVTIDCLGSSNGTIGSITTFPGGWGYDEGRDVYLSDPIDFDDSNRPLGFSAGGVLLAGDLENLALKGSLDSVMTIVSEPQSGV